MEVRRFLAALCLSAALVASAGAVRATAIDDDDDGAAPAEVDTSEEAEDTSPSVTAAPTTAAPPTTAAVPGPSDVVTQYLEAIVEDRVSDSYGLLCPSTQSSVSEQDFTAELTAQRRSHTIRSFRIDDVFGETELGAGVAATVTYGADSPFTALLERESRTAPWRICVINGGFAEVLTWPEALDPDGFRR